MRQPFIFGRSVIGEYFTDREKETEKLLNNFQYGINTILISPRRYGKTSLVEKAISLCEDKNIKFVFIDIFSTRTPEEFCRIFAEALIKQTSSKMEEWINDARQFFGQLAPQININPDPSTEVSLSFGVRPKQPDIDSILDLPEKICKKKNCTIVVCIDEFQQIGEYPESLWFQKICRTHWQHQYSTSYCLFGSRQHMMNGLFEKPGSPFYKFGELINLKKISEENWKAFIIKRFKETNKPIKEEIASEICRLTENYSSYVQQLSWLVWINYEESRQEEALKSSFEELIEHNSLLFEQQTQNLTNYQMNFLKALIDGIEKDFNSQEVMSKYDLGSVGNISRLKNSLIKKELIDYSDGRYRIVDPILKEWLKRKILR